MSNTMEKLEVIAHLGDHITYKEEYGICYDSALAKVIEDAYMTLKNGVTVQEWISVKDRLPEKYGQYLALTPGWLKGDSQYVRLFYYEPERGFYDYDSEWGEVSMDHVTHWMPLPQPPKGE